VSWPNTHVVVHLRRYRLSRLEPLVHIQLLYHFLCASPNLQSEEAAGETAAVAEDCDSLALQGVAAHVCEQRHEGGVHRGAVHISAHGRKHDRRLHTGGKLLLGQSDERLFDVLVRQRGGVVEIAELLGHGIEDWI